MRIKENPSKLQIFVKNRLKNVLLSKRLAEADMTESDKEVAKRMYKLFNERAFSPQVMEKLKAEFLTESDKKRDMQTVTSRINRQSNSEFVRSIRKFYRNTLLEEIEYQESLRESKDIGYRRICWGVFI